MNRENQVTQSLLLCLAGLAILAAGAVAIFLWIPRESPEAESTTAAVLPPDVSRPVEPPREQDLAPDRPTDQGSVTEDARTTREATAPAADETVTPRNGTEPISEDKRPPEPKSSSRRPGPSERWVVQSVSAQPRVFLLDGLDAAGARRRFRPAPINERYVIVSASLSWAGARPRRIVFEASPTRPPTLQLASDSGRHIPLGRLGDDLNPLAPLAVDPVTVNPQDNKALEVVFLLPVDFVDVSFLIDGEVRGALELPPPEQVSLGEIAGIWHKSAQQLKPLRHADPVADAIAAPECQALRIALNDRGVFELTFPRAMVFSDGLPNQGEVSAIHLTLSREKNRRSGWLRATDDGASLVLYVGDEPGAVFLFERNAP